MGVNPSDLQVMMPKTIEVARQYSQDAHKGIANQQNIVKHEEKVHEDSTKKVHDRNETEKIQIKEEDKKEKEQDKNKKEKEDSKEEEKSSPKETKIMGHFDVTV